MNAMALALNPKQTQLSGAAVERCVQESRSECSHETSTDASNDLCCQQPPAVPPEMPVDHAVAAASMEVPAKLDPRLQSSHSNLEALGHLNDTFGGLHHQKADSVDT